MAWKRRVGDSTPHGSLTAANFRRLCKSLEINILPIYARLEHIKGPIIYMEEFEDVSHAMAYVRNGGTIKIETLINALSYF